VKFYQLILSLIFAMFVIMHGRFCCHLPQLLLRATCGFICQATC